jgi:hypothetical protein
MPNHPLRELGPLRFSNQFSNFEFDFDWVGLITPTESTAQSTEMGIDRDPRNTECMAQDHIRGLTAHSWQSDQVIQD